MVESPPQSIAIKNRKTSSSSDSHAVQDSPIFSYISNLSPIQPVNAATAAQGFPGLSYPPLVFTSSSINSQESLQKRWQQSCASELVSQENDKCLKNGGVADDSGEMDPQSSTVLISGDQKDCDAKVSVPFKPCSPSGCIDAFLAEMADRKQANSGTEEQTCDVPQSSQDVFVEKEDNEEVQDMNQGASATLLQQPEFSQGGPRIHAKLMENVQKPWILSPRKCSEIQSMSVMGHVSEKQQFGDSFSEVGHPHHSMLRRCLQFDENQQQCAADGFASCNSSDSQTKFHESSRVLSTTALADGQQFNVTSPANSLCLSSITGNSHFAVPKPTGIGLHLNSIVTVRPVSLEMENPQSSESIVKGKNSVFIMRNHFTNDANTGFASSEVDNVFSTSKIKMLESRSSTPGNLVCQSTLESSSSSMVSQISDNHVPSYGKRKCNSELSESVEVVNQAIPQRKRKKASPDDGGGCKRCNCKRSKCLKLYCDCFAAGLYCAESCACKGCFNRPDYEDTVNEVRQQIESRNPQAFAPKVIQSVTNSSLNSVEVGNGVLSSSLKHKRGCNCKKSMCLKKYCECYQANVGCSDGCRCEGCRNVYGKKEDYGMVRGIISGQVPEEVSLDRSENKLEMLAVRDDLLQDKVCDFRRLTPLTPSLQSNQQRNALSKLTAGRYVLSPDSDFNTSLESYATAQRYSYSDAMFLECRDESIDSSLRQHEDSEATHDGLVNSCHITSLLNPFPMTMVASAYSNGSDFRNISQSVHPLSSTLCWRSFSPITPITQLGGYKSLQDLDSSKKHCDIFEDDIPEILKDSSTPVSSIKVRSPNKKRVSPPHNRRDELGLSPSGALRGSRRFILQAVPCCQPPTPCPVSKEGSTENRIESLEQP